MNNPSIHRTRRAAAGFGLACMLFASHALALDVIDPTGAIYSNITASSQFSAGFAVTNLFNLNVSGVMIGQTIGGAEYAKSGAGDAWVAFQVDQSYSIGSIYWAQRNGASTGDNMQLMSIWSSETDAFTAANPSNAPNNVVALQANVGSPIWREYILTNIVSGHYFLLHLEQTAGNVTGNPGGSEFRLGLNPPPTPPSVTIQPENKSVYTGASVFFKATAAGSVPISYQWYKGVVPLTNNPQISGATSPKLVISGLTSGDQGNYSVALTNAFGNTNSTSASLTTLAAPTETFAKSVLSNSPVAYWQLNESAGTTAFDYAGGYNGTYGGSSVLGVDGPRPSSFPGFASGNTGVQTVGFIVDSSVTLPPLDLTTNNRVTITAWIKPDGVQQAYTGIVFSRSAGTISGLSYDSTGTKLAYEWAANRVTFDTGMLLPEGVWSFVALVVTPTNATLYCGTNSSIRVAVDTFAQPVQTFGGFTQIGLDVDVGESARTFNGTIDDVAIYSSALSESAINGLFAAGVGTIIPLPVEITTQPTNQDLFLGERLALSVRATGTTPIGYQWFKNSDSISGATGAAYTLNGVSLSDTGTYYVVASNVANSVTSSVVTVTVSSNTMQILSPTGVLYTNVLESSRFGNSIAWGATNLFKTDVSSLTNGATMLTEGSGKEWAKAGSGDAWVSFDLDQEYPIGAVYWSQRVGSGTGDNMQILSLWASTTTPFNATNNLPTNATPDVVIALTPNSGNPIWTRYLTTNTINGRYFIAHLQQTTIAGNPGGSEMRLAVTGLPVPIAVSTSGGAPVLTWPAYGVLQQTTTLNNPTWTTATGITSGVPITNPVGNKFFRVKYY